MITVGRWIAGAVSAGALASALVCTASDVRAQGPVTASLDLLVLYGTSTAGPGSINPRIGDRPELKTPPLNTYNTYALVDRKSLALTKGQPVTYAMPNGATLSVTLTDVTGGRYTLHEEVAGGAVKQPIRVDVTTNASDFVFVGPLPYQSGGLAWGASVH